MSVTKAAPTLVYEGHMLMQLARLRTFDARARDGELGRVHDFHFDDQCWLVRHFIVSTSRWLGRDVLVAPAAVAGVDFERQKLWLDLTRRQIEESPAIDLGRPVSEEEAAAYFRYYGWPAYWVGSAFVPFGAPVVPMPPPIPGAPIRTEAEETGGGAHLRSFREVVGFHLRGLDAELGHLEDLLVDHEHFAIRYLIVDPKNWWPGPRVFVLPQLVRGIDIGERVVRLSVHRQDVEGAPPFNPGRALTPADEARIYAHYGVPVEEAGHGLLHSPSPHA